MGMQKPMVELIDTRIDRAQTTIIGTTLTPAYKLYDVSRNAYLWAMDVDLGGDESRTDSGNTVKGVAIADASHGVHRAGPSTKVRLHRSTLTRKYEIVGLASIVSGQVAIFEVTYGASSINVGAITTYGSSYRTLTYTELGDYANNGGYRYGSLPYGIMGKFNASGALDTILVSP